MGRNRHVWADHGLGSAGDAIADRVMEKMLSAVREAGCEQLARIVFTEALFQAFELPKRTKEVRAKAGWVKPKGTASKR